MRATLFTVLLSVAASCATAPPTVPDPALRILFIGNSLTSANDLPGLVRRLAESDPARQVMISSVTFGNYSLEDHWNRGDAQQAIAGARWDYVVLQQGPSALPESRVLLVEYTERFAGEIQRVGGRPAVYMVWPSLDRESEWDAVTANHQAAAEAVSGVLFPAGRRRESSCSTPHTLWARCSDVAVCHMATNSRVFSGTLGARRPAYTARGSMDLARLDGRFYDKPCSPGLAPNATETSMNLRRLLLTALLCRVRRFRHRSRSGRPRWSARGTAVAAAGPAAGRLRGQHRWMPAVPERECLESRRQRRPRGAQRGRTALGHVAGQRAAPGSRHERGVLRHPVHGGAGRPRVAIAYGTDGADYSDESDPGPMPIPRDVPIEGGSAADPNPASGHGRLLVVQQGDCILYELYNTVRTASGFRVSSSAQWSLKVNATRPAGWTSADAAGLPTCPASSSTTRSPPAASATRCASRSRGSGRHTSRPPGQYADASLPPYGTRVRLKPNFPGPVHRRRAHRLTALKRMA